jgi:hypothetical protein
MKVRIPYVFEAEVIQKDGTEPEGVFIASNAEIEIAEMPNLKLAATVDKTDYYFDGETFYTPAGATETQGGVMAPMSVAQWVDRALDLQFVLSMPAGDSRARYREALKNYDNLWTPAKVAAEKPFAEYREDDQLKEQDRLQGMMSGFVILSGGVLRLAAEPVYCVRTFSEGVNDDTTRLFVENSGTATLFWDREKIFPLSQREEAIKKAELVALGRGDKAALPIVPSADVYLYLPEAFQFQPYSREALDKGEISLGEYLEHNGSASPNSWDLIDTIGTVTINKVKRKSIADQVAWLQDQGVEEETILTTYQMENG